MILQMTSTSVMNIYSIYEGVYTWNDRYTLVVGAQNVLLAGTRSLIQVGCFGAPSELNLDVHG